MSETEQPTIVRVKASSLREIPPPPKFNSAQNEPEQQMLGVSGSHISKEDLFEREKPRTRSQSDISLMRPKTAILKKPRKQRSQSSLPKIPTGTKIRFADADISEESNSQPTDINTHNIEPEESNVSKDSKRSARPKTAVSAVKDPTPNRTKREQVPPKPVFKTSKLVVKPVEDKFLMAVELKRRHSSLDPEDLKELSERRISTTKRSLSEKITRSKTTPFFPATLEESTDSNSALDGNLETPAARLERLKKNFERAEREYENELKARAITYLTDIKAYPDGYKPDTIPALESSEQFKAVETNQLQSSTPSTKQAPVEEVKETPDNQPIQQATNETEEHFPLPLYEELRVLKHQQRLQTAEFTAKANELQHNPNHLPPLKPLLRKPSFMTYTSYLNQFLVKKQVPDAKLSDNMMRLSKPRDNGGGMDPPIIPRVYTEDWKPSSRAGERKQKKGGKQDARSDTPQVGTIKEIESKLEWTKLPKDAGKGKLGKATETKVPDKGQKKAANMGNNKMSALQKESGVRKGAVGLSTKRVTLPKIASKSQGIVAKLGQEKPSNQLVQAQYQWLLQQVQKGAGNGAKMDAKFKTNAANDKGATAGSKLPPHLVAANFRITHVPVVTMKPIIVVETAGHPAGHYHDSLTTFISMAGGTGKSEKPFRSKK